MHKTDIDELKPLEICGTQPYFSKSIQLGDIIEWVLKQTGPANINISTFSTSEGFLRKLSKLKKAGRVLRCSLVADIRAARKTVALDYFIRNVFDDVRLCENHSKVVLIFNAEYSVAIVTSQNQTQGNRYEAGIVTTDEIVFTLLMTGFQKILSCDDAD
jgi:hypothetical protein